MPRRLKRASVILALAGGVLAPVDRTAAAQDRAPAAGDTLVAAVTHLTSAYVYLDVGREQGIHNGDTLTVLLGDAGTSRLVVTGTATSRLLAVFGSVPFAVAVGDTLRIARPRAPDPNVTTARETAVPAESRPGLVSPVDRAPRADRRRRSARIGGRVRLSLTGVRSTLDGASSLFASSARTFSSPTLSVRLTATDLAGGWDAVADVRMSRRFASHSLIVPQSQARIYRISLQNRHPASPYELEAGRFPLRQDAARSYWDGIRGGIRSRHLSVGVALGLDPDRFNGGLQTDVRKAAAYGELSFGSGGWRLETAVSAAHVMPDNGWLDHTYLGLEQDVRFGDLQAGMDLVMDRDPERGGWATSRLDLRATVPLPADFAVTGRYRERRPYAYWRSTEVLGTRRTQQSLALSWSAGTASAQAGWTANTAAASVRSDAWTLSVRHADVAGSIGLSATAGLWKRTGGESRHASLSMTAPIGSVRADVQVRHFDSVFGARRSRTEAVRLSIATPFLHRLRVDGSTQYQFGSVTSALSFGIGLTWSF